MMSENYFRDVATIFFAQKKTILKTAIIVSVAAVLIAFLWPPIYQAAGLVLLQGTKLDRPPNVLEEAQYRFKGVTRQDMVSEIEILLSRPLMERTIKQLVRDGEISKGANVQRTVSDALKKLSAEVVPGSNTIDVRFLNRDDRFAANLLTMLLQQYITFRSNLQTPEQAEPFFAGQTDSFGKAIRSSEDDLIKLARETGSANPALEIQNNLQTKLTVEQEIIVLENQRIDLESRIAYLESALSGSSVKLFSAIDNAVIASFADKIQTLLVERARLLRTYIEEGPVIKRFDEQIKFAMKSLHNEVRMILDKRLSQLGAVRDKLAAMRRQVDILDKRNMALQENQFKSNRIQRELDLYKGSYDTFFLRREEVRIGGETGAQALSDVRIFSWPELSASPYFPKKNRVIPIGVVTGLLLGVVIGFIREYFDRTIKKPEEIPARLGLPIVLSIPIESE